MDCNLCTSSAWSGPDCSSCSLNHKAHYLDGSSGGEDKVSFFCVLDSPTHPSISGKVNTHEAWSLGIEKTIRNIIIEYKTRFDVSSVQFHTRWTHAVRCAKDKPIKEDIMACSALFHAELLQYARPDFPILILAFGSAPLISLGFKVKQISSFQGRFFKTELQGREVIVFSTFSRRDLSTNPGKLDVFKDHLHKFMTAVKNVSLGKSIQVENSLDHVISNYVMPHTINALRKLADEIVTYAPEGIDPNKYPLAIDTETNTIYPYREHTKILTFIVAWGPGKAASIPVEHSESYFTLEQVAPFIHRILTCPKPKIMQNAKFDIQILRRKGWEVTNLVWDTMLAEHLLEEDKKGYYGLKDIVRKRVPKYSNYEDVITKWLTDNKVKETKVSRKKKSKEDAPPKLKNAAKKLAEDTGFEAVPLTILNPYGAMDADATWQITREQREDIRKEEVKIKQAYASAASNSYMRDKILFAYRRNNDLSLFQIMQDQLIEATQTLADMELHGVPVDVEYVNKLYNDLDSSILDSKIKIHQMIPGYLYEEFNPKSTHQLRTVLFNTGFFNPNLNKTVCYRGVITPSFTATGAESVDAAFLKRLVLEQDCPLAKEILLYRAMNKAKEPFVSNIRTYSNEDGRMHTTYHIVGTATGRLSSSGENMQNIPAFIGDHNIKKIFVPSDRENNVIVNADGKAAEVRVYAAYSKDANLIKALNDGMDPHSFFAAMTYNPAKITEGIAAADQKAILEVIGIDADHAWSYEDFQNADTLIGTDTKPGPDPEYGKRLDTLRTNIKRVVFGILYGASKFKISSIVGLPQDQSQAIIDSLFRMFPSIPLYIERTKEHLDQFNMVETFFGRRRRFDMQNLTSKLKAEVQRKAINFKIQSTSSDIVIRVLNSVAPVIKNDFKGQLLITVHDSIVFELPKQYVSQMPDVFQKYGVDMVAKMCPWLPVPFKWDLKVGPSYGELKKIKEYLGAAPSITRLDPLEFVDSEVKFQLAAAEE